MARAWAPGAWYANAWEGTVWAETADVTVALTGVSATGSVGSLGESISYAVSGVGATGSVGSVGDVVSYTLAGVAATSGVGSVVPSLTVALVGLSATGATGSMSSASSEGASITGTLATSEIGTLTSSITVALSGVSATGAVGTLATPVVGNVTRSLTGVSASCLTGFLSPVGGTTVTIERVRPRRRRSNLRANIERHVNYMLKRTEPTQEKSGIYREQVPGLTLLAELGAEFRGMHWTGSRAFAVIGSGLYELDSEWNETLRGSLLTSTGRIEFAQGLFSLMLVDGTSGYVLTLADNTFAEITDEDFYGADRVMFLDGKFILNRPDTQQFYWSEAIDTASQYDALDFASAESAPDNIVSILRDHREIWLFGEWSTEVWFPSPGTDQVYARNNGVSIEVGCAACFTPQQIDNTVYWLGKDKHGQGIVWSAGGQGYQPIRISTQELEDELANLSDLSGAWAFVYQDAGQTFYVLQVPGLSTTWVYDASIRRWHERADLATSGELTRWRATTHMFAFGAHVVGDDNGKLYELDPYEWTYAGDPIYREWTTPHNVSASQRVVFFDDLKLDITAGQTASGETPVIEMRYSNDGGETWGQWMRRSTGAIGIYGARPRWALLGSSRDRVWQFRTTDNAKVSIVGMFVNAREGTS